MARPPFFRADRPLPPPLLPPHTSTPPSALWQAKTDLLAVLIKREKPFDADDAVVYAKQIGCAVTHMHKHGYAHRDLKLENCLLCADGRLKLADFGLSERAVEADPQEQCGSVFSVAPEVLARQIVDPMKSDAWSFAVCVFALSSWGFPFHMACPDDGLFFKFQQSLASDLRPSQHLDLRIAPDTRIRAIVDANLVPDPRLRSTVFEAMVTAGIA